MAFLCFFLFRSLYIRKKEIKKHKELCLIQSKILKNIPDLLWFKDPNGVFLQCNKKFEKLQGATENEILGKTDFDFIDYESAEKFRYHDNLAIKEGKSHINQEEVTYLDDGHKEIIETIKTPLYDDNGVILGTLGIARNITELIKSQNKLNDSQRILNDVINTIPVRVFWKDLNLRYIGANNLFAHDAGKNSTNELIGLSDHELSWKNEADLYNRDDINVINSGKPKINYEEPQTDNNGKNWWLNTSKIPLKNAEGTIYGILGTYDDITQRKKNELELANSNKKLKILTNDLEATNKKLEKALQEAKKTQTLQKLNEELHISQKKTQTLNNKLTQINEELQFKNLLINKKNDALNKAIIELKEAQSQLVHSEKMASLGILTAGVAHEINNPLNYIMGGYKGLENLYNKSQDSAPKEVAFLLNSIKNGIERSSAIIKGLNQFSRNNKEHNEQCEIHSIINNCLEMINNQIKNRVEIIKNYCCENLVIIGNVGELHQAFLNILNNAQQSILNEGIINICTQKNNDQIIIQIKDNGVGINDQDIKYITDPFFTTKPPGHGTGLGLSITQKIVNIHRGVIDFKSKQNEGTTVEINFSSQS